MRRTVLAVLAALLLGFPGALDASPPAPASDGPDVVRVGISIGGSHLLALDVELHYDLNSVNLSVGTWLFEDIALSVTGRRYLRESSPSPYVGVGVWSVTSISEGLPFAAFLKVPAGIDWRVVGPQNIGIEGNLSVRMATGTLKEGEKPAVDRSLLFLPAIYLKWGR